jgi:hypothetical protein
MHTMRSTYLHCDTSRAACLAARAAPAGYARRTRSALAPSNAAAVAAPVERDIVPRGDTAGAALVLENVTIQAGDRDLLEVPPRLIAQPAPRTASIPAHMRLPSRLLNRLPHGSPLAIGPASTYRPLAPHARCVRSPSPLRLQVTIRQPHTPIICLLPRLIPAPQHPPRPTHNTHPPHAHLKHTARRLG